MLQPNVTAHVTARFGLSRVPPCQLPPLLSCLQHQPAAVGAGSGSAPRVWAATSSHGAAGPHAAEWHGAGPSLHEDEPSDATASAVAGHLSHARHHMRGGSGMAAICDLRNEDIYAE